MRCIILFICQKFLRTAFLKFFSGWGFHMLKCAYCQKMRHRLTCVLLRRLNIIIKDIQRIFSTPSSETVLEVLDKKVRDIVEQYLFGPGLMVQSYSDRVVFPEGKWVDYWTGAEYRGGET